MNYLNKTLFSYWFTIFMLFLLGAGAAVGTFIENDYGTATARIFVYNSFWYEIVMTLAIVNLLGIIYRHKMWNKPPKFVLHLSFVVILIGAALTRFIGFEGIMQIREGESSNKMLSTQTYLIAQIKEKNQTFYKEYPLNLSAFGGNFKYSFAFDGGKIITIDYNSYKYAKQGQSEMSLLKVDVSYNNKKELFVLVGNSGMQGMPHSALFGDANVTLSFGSKIIEIPFSIKLRDFELQRYPGSMSPSSYASEVTVEDNDTKTKFDFRIFMNNTLEYGEYKFFQSSFDRDEKGTVLSVNNDPGKIPTYLGYFLLTLGFLWTLFDKNGRFWNLSKYLKSTQAAIFVVAFIFTFNQNIFANESVNYLSTFKNNSSVISEQFGKLIVQDSGGRMKPLNTLNYEIVNKISKKSEFLGMNPDQVVLGMLSRPDVWKDVKMVKITTAKLKKELGIDETSGYISFSDAFGPSNKYKLETLVADANAKKPNERGTFEKDILQVDERLNIVYMVFSGSLFKIFPEPNSVNHKWLNPVEAINTLGEPQRGATEVLVKGFLGGVYDMNYTAAEQYLHGMSNYQKKLGSEIYPDSRKVELELFSNKVQIFGYLTLAYLLFGFVILIYSFIGVFKKSFVTPKLDITMIGIGGILFFLHTSAMALRWYISGHAPWSDTYESLLYIAWSSMFAGIVFFRKNMLALSATVIMTAVFMFTANLTNIDPQITNLVPVLKSYWLTIHVSIITGSYGFLAIGAMLGFIALILFIFRKDNPHIDKSIYQITAINEMALIVGLAFLTIGNFIGGVWANESWGRYWGWDPKETWAYVSIVVYVIVIHLRFMKRFDNPFVFSAASLLAFSSILMTYFGVNFYLSGMHSYATGDPVPVPMWVYVCIVVVFTTIALAYKNRGLEKLNLSFSKNK